MPITEKKIKPQQPLNPTEEKLLALVDEHITGIDHAAPGPGKDRFGQCIRGCLCRTQ